MHNKGSQTSVAPAGPSTWSRWAPLCLLLITLLGFSLRVAYLDSLPLSLSLDESVDGLDALQLLRTHWLTPFLQNNFGRETLFLYVQGLALQLFGISSFSLRYPSVVAGVLTITLAYAVGRRLALPLAAPPGLPVRTLTGLLAAAGLAMLYWHIYFSRQALRAIMLPPLALGALWCFWRGWHASQAPAPGSSRRVVHGHLWLAAAGVLLGLTLYTYLAARLLPLVFLVFAILETTSNRAAAIRKVIGLLILLSVTTLVSIPLVIYFVRDSEALGSRMETIAIPLDASLPHTLATNLLNLVRIQFAGGRWLGHWPSLGLLSALGLLVGLMVCVRYLRQPASRLLLIWWILGLAPVLLSRQDWDAVTTILRGIVAWPAISVTSAVGLCAVFGTVIRWTRHVRLRPVWFATPVILVVVFGMLQDVRGYFFTWAQTCDDSNDDPRHVAAYLNRQTSQISLTPSQFYANPMYNFLLQDRYRTVANIDADTLGSLLASGTGNDTHAAQAMVLMPHETPSPDKVLSFVLLVPSADGNGTAYLLPPLSHGQVAALLAQTATTPPTATILNGRGETVAATYPLPADAPFLPVQPVPVQPIQARFGQDVLLDGYLVEPPVIDSSDPVGLYLRFQALRWIDGDYALFVHVVDVTTGQRWAQVDTALGGSTQLNAHRWPPRLIVLDLQQFQMPPAAPDGAYRFEVGVYRRPSTSRLPVTLAGVDTSDDKVVLGKFRVARQAGHTPLYPLRVEFEGNIALTGMDLAPRGSKEIALTLYWQALGPVTEDYTMFMHLLARDGSLIAQQDNMPQGGRYPTSLWSTGETVADAYVLSLPEALPAGSYDLWVGVYDADTGQRLQLAGVADDHVELPLVATDDGRVGLQETER